jgi:tetratricopeptide (TPR) repeat protein
VQLVTIHKAKWLLVGLVWLAFWPVDAPAQGNEWESYRDVGVEKQFATAVRAAEEFGPEDLRLAESINGLAEVFRAQGKFAEVELLHKRALAIQDRVSAHASRWQSYMTAATAAYQHGNYVEAEKQLSAALKEAERFGVQAPRLATTLNNLATVYQVQGQYGEAEAAGLGAEGGAGPAAKGKPRA